MVASSAVSIGIAVRTGVRELQVLASFVAHRLEQATGAPSEPALVKKLAIDLYLDPKRTLHLADERLRLLRLTRQWVLSGAFGRKTSKRTTRALDAAERRFKRYWLLIAPFSDLLRRIALRLVAAGLRRSGHS